MSLRSLTDILNQLRARFPALGARIQESSALSRWEEAVGGAIARHSRALRIQDGVLWIEVDHPAWKSELHHRRRQILEKLNALLAEAGAEQLKDLHLVEPRTEFRSSRIQKKKPARSALPLPTSQKPNHR